MSEDLELDLDFFLRLKLEPGTRHYQTAFKYKTQIGHKRKSKFARSVFDAASVLGELGILAEVAQLSGDATEIREQLIKLLQQGQSAQHISTSEKQALDPVTVEKADIEGSVPQIETVDIQADGIQATITTPVSIEPPAFKPETTYDVPVPTDTDAVETEMVEDVTESKAESSMAESNDVVEDIPSVPVSRVSKVHEGRKPRTFKAMPKLNMER